MSCSSDRAPSGSITHSRRQDRATDELVGLCRGLLADGHVCEQEATFLMNWIERNSEFVEEYPFNRIYSMLSLVLADGKIDPEESADLHDTLIRFVGGEADEPFGQTASRASLLPVDVPEPAIIHLEKSFVVTGTFDYGTRSTVIAAIESRGGRTASAPSRRTDFLIIGELGSRDWINSNAGRKIQAAIALRDAGHRISIVSEAHWLTHLQL